MIILSILDICIGGRLITKYFSSEWPINIPYLRFNSFTPLIEDAYPVDMQVLFYAYIRFNPSNHLMLPPNVDFARRAWNGTEEPIEWPLI